MSTVSPQTLLEMFSDNGQAKPDPNTVLFGLVQAWEDERRCFEQLHRATKNKTDRLMNAYRSNAVDETNIVFYNGRVYLVQLDLYGYPDQCNIYQLPATAVHDDGSGPDATVHE
jgi:hypothetical protein